MGSFISGATRRLLWKPHWASWEQDYWLGAVPEPATGQLFLGFQYLIRDHDDCDTRLNRAAMCNVRVGPPSAIANATDGHGRAVRKLMWINVQ